METRIDRTRHDAFAAGYVDGLQNLPARPEGFHQDARGAYRAAYEDGQDRRAREGWGQNHSERELER